MPEILELEELKPNTLYRFLPTCIESYLEQGDFYSARRILEQVCELHKQGNLTTDQSSPDYLSECNLVYALSKVDEAAEAYRLRREQNVPIIVERIIARLTPTGRARKFVLEANSRVGITQYLTQNLHRHWNNFDRRDTAEFESAAVSHIHLNLLSRRDVKTGFISSAIQLFINNRNLPITQNVIERLFSVAYFPCSSREPIVLNLFPSREHQTKPAKFLA